jgi:outer membrane protein assembly factor BamB
MWWATENGFLSCVDIATGETIWERRYGQGLSHQWPLVRSQCVYVLDGRWHLLAFDCVTGELRWMSRLRAPGCSGALEYGQYLCVLSNGGQIAVFDPEREVKVWEGSVGGQHRQPPALAAGWLAAASNDEGLKVFRIASHYERS